MKRKRKRMKKIISMILVLTLALFAFAACKKDETPEPPAEKTYTLVAAVDSSYKDGKVTNYVAALVLDADGKIVAARLDCAETSITAADGKIADVASVTTKVELGDNYKMEAGNFANQTKAFESLLVGKTAAEVAALNTAPGEDGKTHLVAGCTMPYTPAAFQAVVAKAFASANKSTFKTADSFTLGLAVNMSVSGGKATANFGATAVIGGKVAATVLDTCERSFSVNEEGAVVAGNYAGTKFELGENYKMDAGTFAEQITALQGLLVGKTAAEVAALNTAPGEDGKTHLVAGCTMPYTPAYMQAVVAKTFTNAR